MNTRPGELHIAHDKVVTSHCGGQGIWVPVQAGMQKGAKAKRCQMFTGKRCKV